MTRTETPQIDADARQRNCYGCTTAELRTMVLGAERLGTAAPMFAISTLSDVQEQIERGMREQARQGINRAKFVISEQGDRLQRIEQAAGALLSYLNASPEEQADAEERARIATAGNVRHLEALAADLQAAIA